MKHHFIDSLFSARLPQARGYLQALLVALGCASTGGCVIENGSDDDGADDGTGGDGADGADDGTGADGADDGADDGAPSDETGGDGGAAGGPEPGAWLYEETGAATNGCAFLEDPSNGFGTYVIAAVDGGSFTITPGDDTDPFTCTHDGATFQCDERLQEEVDAGGSTLAVLVSASGDLVSATEMQGTQDGHVECDGADCAAAEELLGTTFPCEFSIPWRGTKM